MCEKLEIKFWLNEKSWWNRCKNNESFSGSFFTRQLRVSESTDVLAMKKPVLQLYTERVHAALATCTAYRI